MRWPSREVLKLSESEMKVLTGLGNSRECSLGEVARCVGFSSDRAHQVLFDLVRRDLVRYVGDGSWRATPSAVAHLGRVRRRQEACLDDLTLPDVTRF